MIYKPYCSSPPPPPAFLHRTHNLSPAIERKKSHSIKPVLHFSPHKPADNPQEKRKDQPLEEKKWMGRPLKSFTNVVKQPTQSLANLRFNHKHMSTVCHNLSSNNLRTTFSPVPFARRDRQLLNKSKDVAKQLPHPPGDSTTDLKREWRQGVKKEEKRCKEAPSFIKNKNAHNAATIEDFKIVRSLRETEEYKEMVALHHKSRALFTVKRYKKEALGREKELCEQIRFYLKNLQISHNLIVKCFGCFHDADNLYIVEEFLPGETMREFTARRTEPLNEQEVGPKVCEILTALTYLSSLQLSYGNLTQDNILHALNICKLKRPYLVYQGKDLLFDIWCLGKLVFEMVTLCSLVEEHLLEGMHQVKQLFSSTQIVMALEVGFKRFEGSCSLSRDLIAFLVATLWDIQSEQLTLEQVWELEFVKLYREQQDIWHSRTAPQ